jgi:hypothetical protein
MSNSLVVFGPWCGEFSYELQWWVPEIRKRRKTDFKDFHAIHVGYEGRSFLYHDFIDDYISYPKDLEKTLKYSNNFAQGLPGGTRIPDNIKLFIENYIEGKKNSYNQIVVYLPTDLQVRCYEDYPYGEFIHYSASGCILNEMKNEICFEDSSRKTVALLSRVRYRNGGRGLNGKLLQGITKCHADWNPKHWEIFVDMLINMMGLNVCVIDIPPVDSNGGSLSFRDSEVYRRNKKYIKSIRFAGKDSVERQVALLQLTDCSIYGCTGVATLPYFVKTPVFMQQTKKESRRKKFQWQINLTDNLKNVCIFDKYSEGDLYDSSPVEMFICFRDFFRGLF